LEQTWALASCHIQVVVASTGDVRTCLEGEFGSTGGRLSSITIGFRVPIGVKKNIVRVA